MPELPEVECWGRRVLEKQCVGKKIKSVFSAHDTIVYKGVKPETFAKKVRGREVVAAHRKGKQLWIELDKPPHPLLHFGMTGKIVSYTDPDERPRYCKIELKMDDGTFVAMPNPRRLGRIRLLEDPPNQEPLSKLGFDALTEMPGPAHFVEQVLSRKSTVKGLLMSQSFAAGVGNWIADEVLYQAKIAPQRRCNELSDKEARHLRTKLSYVLDKAIEAGADKSKFPRTWLFHDRWGKDEEATTARGEKIEFDKVAGRTTAWVPARQS